MELLSYYSAFLTPGPDTRNYQKWDADKPGPGKLRQEMLTPTVSFIATPAWHPSNNSYSICQFKDCNGLKGFSISGGGNRAEGSRRSSNAGRSGGLMLLTFRAKNDAPGVKSTKSRLHAIASTWYHGDYLEASRSSALGPVRPWSLPMAIFDHAHNAEELEIMWL